MDQTGGGTLPEDTEQKQSSSVGWKVSELLLSLTNIENERQKYLSLLEQTHISFFRTMQLAVRSNNWDAAACSKCSFLCKKSLHSSFSQIGIAKENAESLRIGMIITDSSISEDVKQLSKSEPKISFAGGHKKYYASDSLHKCVFGPLCVFGQKLPSYAASFDPRQMFQWRDIMQNTIFKEREKAQANFRDSCFQIRQF